jgi:hypothetical protein
VSLAVTLALSYRDRSVTPKCHAAETPTIKGVTLRRDTSNPPRGIEASRPSIMLQQTVTLHRDTSTPLGGGEVSRQVWTSLVRPLALNSVTTTLALQAAALRRRPRDRPLSRPNPALGPYGGSTTDSTICGRMT